MPVISSPGELVAMVPTVLGFTPDESVVVVMLRDRTSLASVVRLDLSDLLGDDAGAAALDIARLAVRENTRRAVVIAYSRDEGAGCLAADRATAALDDAVGGVEAWVVSGGRFFNPDCVDPTCCPPGGRPVPRSLGVDAARRARSDVRRLCARAADRWARRAHADVLDWRRRSLAQWRAALEGGVEGPAPVGRLAAGLADLRVRDSVLLSLIPGADRAVLDALHGRDTPAISDALGTAMRPTAPPDPSSSAALRAVLDTVLAHVPARLAAPPAAMLGVLAWWERRPELSRAWCAIALDHDPGYRLARLTLALVDHSEVSR